MCKKSIFLLLKIYGCSKSVEWQFGKLCVLFADCAMSVSLPISGGQQSENKIVFCSSSDYTVIRKVDDKGIIGN